MPFTALGESLRFHSLMPSIAQVYFYLMHSHKRKSLKFTFTLCYWR